MLRQQAMPVFDNDNAVQITAMNRSFVSLLQDNPIAIFPEETTLIQINKFMEFALYRDNELLYQKLLPLRRSLLKRTTLKDIDEDNEKVFKLQLLKKLNKKDVYANYFKTCTLETKKKFYQHTNETELNKEAEDNTEAFINSKMAYDTILANDLDSLTQLANTPENYIALLKNAFNQNSVVELYFLLQDNHLKATNNDCKKLIRLLLQTNDYELASIILAYKKIDLYQLALEWRNEIELLNKLLEHCCDKEKILKNIIHMGIDFKRYPSQKNKELFTNINKNKNEVVSALNECLQTLLPAETTFDATTDDVALGMIKANVDSENLTYAHFQQVSILAKRFGVSLQSSEETHQIKHKNAAVNLPTALWREILKYLSNKEIFSDRDVPENDRIVLASLSRTILEFSVQIQTPDRIKNDMQIMDRERIKKTFISQEELDNLEKRIDKCEQALNKLSRSCAHPRVSAALLLTALLVATTSYLLILYETERCNDHVALDDFLTPYPGQWQNGRNVSCYNAFIQSHPAWYGDDQPGDKSDDSFHCETTGRYPIIPDSCQSLCDRLDYIYPFYILGAVGFPISIVLGCVLSCVAFKYDQENFERKKREVRQLLSDAKTDKDMKSTAHLFNQIERVRVAAEEKIEHAKLNDIAFGFVDLSKDDNTKNESEETRNKRIAKQYDDAYIATIYSLVYINFKNGTETPIDIKPDVLKKLKSELPELDFIQQMELIRDLTGHMRNLSRDAEHVLKKSKNMGYLSIPIFSEQQDELVRGVSPISPLRNNSIYKAHERVGVADGRTPLLASTEHVTESRLS